MTRSGGVDWQSSQRRLLSVLALGVLLGFEPSGAKGICGDSVIDARTSSCACDCNGDNAVTVDEILRILNIPLGTAPLTVCPAADHDGSEAITVDEIVLCINNTLSGCPAPNPDSHEECDNGGLCVGGANAGVACDVELDCEGDGACFGGANDLRACSSDNECAGAPCRKCRPYGGDGCAANCTFEVDEVCELLSDDGIGIVPPLRPFGSLLQTLSGAEPNLLPLSLSGTQVLTVGKVLDGSVPVVIKASGFALDRVAISTIACLCIRGVVAGTCGGTLFDRSGAPSANCSPGFSGSEICPNDKPCAAVYGPGNAGSGFIGCGDPGVDVDVTQDCNGTTGGNPFDPQVTVTRSAGAMLPDRGSAFLALASAIGTVVGACAGSDAAYGPDGQFCTDDDALANRGMPRSVLFTTRTASATVFNPFDFESGQLGPIDTHGAPFICDANGAVSVTGANLAGAFTSCHQSTTSDHAAVMTLVCR